MFDSNRSFAGMFCPVVKWLICVTQAVMWNMCLTSEKKAVALNVWLSSWSE